MASPDDTVGYGPLVEQGLALAVGLLMMGYAANTMLWYSYQRADPAVAEGPASFGFLALVALAFIAGTILSYVTVMRGVQEATG